MKRLIVCLLCGSEDIAPLFSSMDRMFSIPMLFHVKQCRNCRLVFLHPQPGRSVLKKHYPTNKYYAYTFNTGEDFFGRIRSYLIRMSYKASLWSRVLNVFISVPAMPSPIKRGRILDVGCGTGETLALLSRLGWETYGVEIDTNAVAIARKRGLSDVSPGTDKDIRKYPDNFFDVIRLYHVIEHINDPVRSLYLIRRKLKKGGELIIGTPNVASMISKMFRTYWYNLDAPRHLYLFSPLTLRRTLIKTGFVPTTIEFSSAGGVVGSMQYFISDKTKRRLDALHNPWLILLFYPLEWMLDRLHKGDVFVMRATIPT